MNALAPIVASTLAPEPWLFVQERLPTQRKWPIAYQAIEPLAMLFDVVTILTACLGAAAFTQIAGAPLDFGKAAGSMILVSSLFVCRLKMRGLYRPAELLAHRNQIRAVVWAWASVLVLLAVALGPLGIGQEIPRSAGLFAVIGLLLLIGSRVAAKRILWLGLRGQKFMGRDVVVISDRPASAGGGLEQSHALFGSCVRAEFKLPPPGAGFGYQKRLSAHVINYVQGANIAEIVIEADPTRWSELRSFISDLRVLPFPIAFVPVGAGAEILRRPTREGGSVFGLELQRGPLSLAEHASKRALDVIGATIILMLLSPLLAVAAIAIKLDSPGPILFRQQRCGFNGRSFAIRKFRTMSVLEDGPTIVQAQHADDRITRVGKWLRRTSIDELPQLLNVLDGSMCLVGPRPHALAHDSQFNKIVRNYGFRRRVKPGLTGWAQVHGCRGATPTTETVEKRIQYDLWYIDNWSLKLDIKILLQTPLEVVRGRNAI